MTKQSKIIDSLLYKFGIPVNLSEILSKEKISLLSKDMELSVSGFLVVKKTNTFIAVNKTHHPNRQRFTIAHELGHYFLHSKKSPTFIDMTSTIYMRDALSSTGVNKTEIEANKFAAELLMPTKYLKDKISKHSIDYFDDLLLRELATELQVSIQALSIRLSEIGLISDAPQNL